MNSGIWNSIGPTQLTRLVIFFFTHHHSVQLTTMFLEVIFIDATYKTNKYKMPLVELICVSYTGMSFQVAYAYISHEKEENYVWALEHLRQILGHYVTPSVFVTDREVALMNAIKLVYPTSDHLLCQWHIKTNIIKNCKGSFKEKEQFEVFMNSWDHLVNAKTEEEYVNRWEEFKFRYRDYKQDIMYIEDQWLAKYKERFISAWTNNVLHFGNVTTNRVEAAHAVLKSYLNSTVGTLLTNFNAMHNLLEGQFLKMRDSFTRSSVAIQHIYNIQEFDELRGLIAREALNELNIQMKRTQTVGADTSACGCISRKTHGLPCAHMIVTYSRQGRPIPLSSIHPRWRKLSEEKINLSKGSLDCEPELANIRRKFEIATSNEK